MCSADDDDGFDDDGEHCRDLHRIGIVGLETKTLKIQINTLFVHERC